MCNSMYYLYCKHAQCIQCKLQWSHWMFAICSACGSFAFGDVSSLSRTCLRNQKKVLPIGNGMHKVWVICQWANTGNEARICLMSVVRCADDNSMYRREGSGSGFVSASVVRQAAIKNEIRGGKVQWFGCGCCCRCYCSRIVRSGGRLWLSVCDCVCIAVKSIRGTQLRTTYNLHKYIHTYIYT